MSVCKVKAGAFLFELDATDEKVLFEKIAHIQEVFDQSCGKCGSESVRLLVRTVDDNKYYEMACNSCRAKLAYGSHKKGGTLFPKRKDKDDSYLPNGGWTIWSPDKQVAE